MVRSFIPGLAANALFRSPSPFSSSNRRSENMLRLGIGALLGWFACDTFQKQVGASNAEKVKNCVCAVIDSLKEKPREKDVTDVKRTD